MNPQNTMNDNEQLEKEEQAIGEPTSPYPQASWNAWYNHESNKERTIAAWERQQEEDTNPFN